MILSRGRGVLLRDFTSGDLPTYLRWVRGDGLWKKTDAPWEHVSGGGDETRGTQESQFSGLLDDLDNPRRVAAIEVDGGLIGWVNRYQDGNHPEACMVGIDVCEDAMLGRGYGYEALRLWVGYLFSSGAFHRLGLATYSFNGAMQGLALKLGFREEGRQREVHFWDGEWVDRLTYGMLVSEWKTAESFAPNRRDLLSGS